MMRVPRCLFAAVALLFSASLHADEGMWLIQDINSALEKNMKARGLKLSSKEIYNAEAPGSTVSDAVVSIGFYCTGSLISDNGLIITIGDENSEDMKDVSLITADYRVNGKLVGKLGVIGPTRMKYSEISSVIKYLTDNISRSFEIESDTDGADPVDAPDDQ